MGDPLGAVGSIVGIAAFGLKFATTLQTYIEAVADAEESLREIALDVSETASALKQLEDYMKPDQSGQTIANDSGVEDVARLASQCEKVYTVIIYIIAKAVGVPKDDNGKVTLDALDLHSLDAPSRMRKLIWPLREYRIRKHREELRWLKFSLLFRLGLMELAKNKKMGPARSPDAYERELALHAKVEKLHAQMEAYINKIISRRSEKNKTRRKSSAESSSSSSIGKVTYRRSSSRRGQSIAKTSDHSYTRSLSSVEDADRKGKKPSSFGGIIDNDSKITPPTHAPDVIDGTPKAPVGLPGNSVVENNKDPENHTDYPKQTEPFPRITAQEMPGANSTASQTQTHPQIDAQDSPANADTSQPVDCPRSTNASNDERETPHDHTIEYPGGTERYTPEPSRGIFGALLWTSNLFRKRYKLVHDWKSQEIEGYLVESDTGTIRKLPFNRQELINQITRITKSKQGSVLKQYASLTSAQRESVDRVIAEASRSSHRMRSCVAIDQQLGRGQRQSHITAFFSLSAAQLVHVKFGANYFQFAFELCRTWEGINGLIRQVVCNINTINSPLIQGMYELRGLDDKVISREMWCTTVHPGLVVFIAIFEPQVSHNKASHGATQSDQDMRLQHIVQNCCLAVDHIMLSSRPGVDHRILRWIKHMFSRRSKHDQEPLEGASEIHTLSESSQADSIGSIEHSQPGDVGTEETEENKNERGEIEREEEDDEEDVDIINFEEEEMNARLGLGVQLGMWTTVFDTAENNKDGQDGS